MPFCRDIITPEVNVVIRRLRRTLIDACNSAVVKAQSSSRSYCNSIPLLRYATMLMYELNITAVPTDKDGGFGLIAKPILSQQKLKMLQTDVYEECLPGEDDVPFALWHARLARRIEALEAEDGLAKELMKSSKPGCNWRAKLTLTMKSHKDVVTFRNIHAMPKWGSAGVARWISMQCRQATNHVDHILTTTHSFVATASRMAVPANACMIRLDVEDFFLSGDPMSIINDALMAFTGARRLVMKDALTFVLQNQFVTTPEFPDKVWRCRVGTGMGLQHSGDLCDLTFYMKAEKWFMEDNVLEDFGVLLYQRYRDDIIIVYTDRSGIYDFVRELKRRAGYFRLKVEAVSKQMVPFLESDVWIRDGKLVLTPRFKPTALLRPLSHESVHPRHVHLSWPVQMVRRLSRISNCREAIHEAHKRLVARFISYSAHPDIIHAVRNADPFHRGTGVTKQRVSTVWCRFPFHPVWVREVNMALGRFSSDEHSKYLFKVSHDTDMPVFRAAWCNGGVTLNSMLPKWRLDGVSAEDHVAVA